MSRSCLLLWFTCLFARFSQAQNIIPNGNFETMSSFTCADNPISGFQLVSDWYSYDTPHLITRGCPYDPAVWHFYNPSALPVDGLNTVGLTGQLFVDGVYSSVAMGVKLTTPIRAGREYYLQFNARNRGLWHRIPDSLRVCDTDPPRQVQVYFGDQDFLYPTEFIGRPADFTFSSPELQGSEPGGWVPFNQCFTATGDHSDFGISLNRGAVNMSPPCVFRESGDALNYLIYHFDLDQLILYPVPDRIDTIFSSCGGKTFDVDLRELAGVPPEVPVVFDWADGFSGAQRSLSAQGSYEITAKLPCTSFPVKLTIALTDCAPDTYVPNAFSPNRDGVNDTFAPFINSPYPIQNFSLQIFDRWGTKLFETHQLGAGWEGMAHGRELGTGVYVWTMQYELLVQDEVQRITDRGEVVLMR